MPLMSTPFFLPRLPRRFMEGVTEMAPWAEIYGNQMNKKTFYSLLPARLTVPPGHTDGRCPFPFPGGRWCASHLPCWPAALHVPHAEMGAHHPQPGETPPGSSWLFAHPVPPAETTSHRWGILQHQGWPVTVFPSQVQQWENPKNEHEGLTHSPLPYQIVLLHFSLLSHLLSISLSSNPSYSDLQRAMYVLG